MQKTLTPSRPSVWATCLIRYLGAGSSCFADSDRERSWRWPGLLPKSFVSYSISFCFSSLSVASFASHSPSLALVLPAASPDKQCSCLPVLRALALSLSLCLKIKQNEGKIKQRFDNQKNEARPKSEKGKNPAHTLAHTHAHRHTHTMIKFKAEIYLCSESTQRESEREGGRERQRENWSQVLLARLRPAHKNKNTFLCLCIWKRTKNK